MVVKMKLKEITVMQGFTNRQEAIAHKNLLKGESVLVSVINASGMPVTPICYFIVAQPTLDHIQEVLLMVNEE
jgi:hypothetical protein